MRYGVKAILILLMFIMIGNTSCVEAVATSAKSYILVDLATGQVLSASNQEMRIYPASLTKLLTAWVVVRNADLDEVVNISKTAVNVDGTRAYFAVGEKYTVEELLYALLLRSANDAAIALAEHVAGSTGNFVQLMNEEAASLGASHSNFTNPHGLHDDDHYTTAADFALLCRKVFSDSVIRQICSQHTKVISNPSAEYDRLLTTTNKLINPKSPYYYSRAQYGKTGYTSQAGQCIAVVASDGSQELLAILFGCQGRQVWTDAKRLIDYGFKSYDCIKLASRGAVLAAYSISGAAEALCVTVAETVYAVVDSSSSHSNYSVDIRLDEDLKAPINRGESVGLAVFTNGEKTIAKEELVAVYAVPKKRSSWYYTSLVGACIIGVFSLLGRLLQKYTHKLTRGI